MKGKTKYVRNAGIVVFMLVTLVTYSSADTLYTDAKIIVTGESSLQYQKGVINEHIAAMYKIWNWFKAVVPDSNFKRPFDTLNSKHMVRIRRDSPQLLDYTVPFGGMWTRIDNNQIVHLNSYKIKKINPTSAEYLEYEKTKKIPGSFKAINADSALYIAREFLDNVLNASRVGYMSTVFDSAKINEINWLYIIVLKCKMKNDIHDPRYAEIRICAKTGIVDSYNGDLNLSYNLDYIPKITKEEALIIYREHMKRNNDTAAIKTIRLSKNNRSKQKWGWTIFATPPGKGGFNYYIIIDSENGAILQDCRF